MAKNFSLEYWIDEGWYVGRLKEVPGVFSQGETLEELEENIKDAYRLMMKEQPTKTHLEVQTKEISLDMA